ncbi:MULTISPECIES: class I adenylate-forming enzyme family protein [unclassified Pseudoalteromonas]|uniref:class I adenylate-forming enzyme family protein n=1 Tax=unclassified Pseudoalteromonas TaxID=194690 RepID=UPI0025B2FC1A|nr:MULTISPECIES: class I adenylate-forming enzyme family protein [unclassified Pseudoalteromonas]MDN3378973.1 class I adenylate-forming enzyme family protein [Pseudoalteromonas sp. APC 3893]MDN3387619.1 class I adenylate-forming enzyme family protein [Pseudoalteromonas sp. APC 4017]
MSYHGNLSLIKRMLAQKGERLSVSNLIDVASKLHGDKSIFFQMSESSTDNSRGLSAQFLRKKANIYSNILKNKYRINRYDRVGILLDNSMEYHIWFLAIVRAGGIAVPMNGDFDKVELDEYLTQTNVNILVTESVVWGENYPTQQIEHYISLDDKNLDMRGCYVEDAAKDQSDEFECIKLSPDDVILIPHTSGTTGIPKPVTHTDSTLVAVLLSNSKAIFTSKDEQVMLVMPCNHWISHCAFLVTLVSCDTTRWLVKDFSAKFVLENIDKYKTNNFIAFAGNYAKMYNEGLDNYCLDTIKMWVSVADVSYEVHQREFVQKGALLRVFGKVVMKSLFIDLLGSSETGVPALMRSISSYSSRFGRYLGRPVNNSLKVNVVDEYGNEVPVNQPGRLVVSGPTVFKGYWNNSEKELGVFHNDWWWTGDVVYKDRQGRFYHLDRGVNLIETSNGSISTLAMEEQVIKVDGVLNACVLGINLNGDDNLSVACVIQSDVKEEDYDSIVSTIKQFDLAKEVKHFVFTLNEFPRGLTGKVLKRSLKSSISEHFNQNKNEDIKKISVV